MTDTTNNSTILTEAYDIRIYSKRAIYLFSLVFCPIFGGALLMQNLRDIDNKKAANQVMLLSVLYTLACIVFMTSMNNPPRFLTYVLNLFGAGVLTEYFFKKHFSNAHQYKTKPIWKPLIISIIIIIPFVWAMIYTADHGL